MNAIGFRVSPNEIFYSIINDTIDEYEIVSISSLKIPNSLGVSEKLSYIRNSFITIVNQYDVSFAGIKLIEGNARSSINNPLIFRFQIEGVLIELFTNSNIKTHFLGVASNIASTLNVNRKKPAEMLEETIDLSSKNTDDKKKITNEHKEAILVAICALHIGVNNV